MKKLICMVLALMLALGMSSALASTYYGGYDDVIEASIVVYQRSNQGAAEDIWWWDFCEAYFGIKFNVTQVTSASDYKSVAFMSGDMPDVFYQMFMDSSAVVEQGVTNGYLIPLDEYITPEIMPNLSRIFEAHPEYRSLISAGDGKIYSLGVFQNAESPLMTFYINQRWLDEAGLEMPTTLDEFTEVMAAFKARGEDVVPLTGDLGNQPRFIANAFGWITDSASYLTKIALKDNVPMFIYADEERFPAFMEVMKEYIELGYFSADVFDDQYAGNQTAAQKANDLTGFDQNTSNAIDPNEWTAAIPLTSEWKDTPSIARSYNAVNCQSFNISSKCDPAKIERLMKWVDWLYDYDNYTMSHWGPSVNETEWLLGLESGYTATMDEATGKYVYSAAEVDNGTYTSWGDYQNRRIQGIIGGYLGLNIDMFGEGTREYNPPTYLNKVDENVLPYLVDCYPNIVFFDADTNTRISELATEINAYVNEQYVAFISGEKEMSEENLAEYFQTIYDLGYEEYVQYYIDYYDAYLGK
ncbi:MAG: extracellular solute-binding protein [Clostridia bacterium]|nr:extracellular solute-binding protein [Clostridia bacterium]